MDVNTKYAPSPARGTAADAKKNQGVNKKLHLGTSRRRESAGASNNERPPKYNVQKAKDSIKRPRPKGQYHGGTKENSKVVEEKFPEDSSVLFQRNKKGNTNLLVNFHYEGNMTRDVPRDTGRYSCNSNRLLPPVQRHKYNKEQFVQASCQFVVTANRDYSIHLTNPDILVDWKLIEQIKLYNLENFSCPICLHAPVAAKMTRCGHVYCWPCILRYLRYCQETGNYKCPICDEYLHKNDLKSVVEITRSTFNLGDTINLRLMRRVKPLFFVTPVEPATLQPTTFLSVSENADNRIYSKLLIATVKYIMDIIECESSELELELKDNPDMAIDIKQALNELSKRKEKLLWEGAELKDALPMVNVLEKEIVEETSQGNGININACCKDDAKSLAKQSSIDSISSDNQSVSNPSKTSYFYQAEDGQYMFLHVMNVKMLEAQYGSLEQSPPVITGKLLEKEAGICTADIRRRFCYLQHLPITCPFELVEIEMKPPLVSKEIIDKFREQLDARQKRREQKEREERKREKKITEQENRQIGIFPTPNIDIESYQHFPQLQSELQFPNEPTLSPTESATSSIASSPPLNTFDGFTLKQETDHSREQTRTFADIAKLQATMIAKTHNKSTNAWPSMKSKRYSNAMGMLSNKDEEEESSTVTTRYNEYVNAWPSMKTKSDATGGTLSNKDEEISSTTSAHNTSVNAWPFVKSKRYSDITSTLTNKDEEAASTIARKAHDKSAGYKVWPAVKSGTSFGTPSSSSNEDEKKLYVSEETKDEGNTSGKKKKKKKGKGKEKEKEGVVLATGMTSGYSL